MFERSRGSRIERAEWRRPAGAAGPRLGSRKGKASVLVVDDQNLVLELVNAFLEDSGYRVHLALGGRRALAACESLGGAVDLLLTDVRMPGMSGPELYRRVAELYPGVKALFMSGFARSEAALHGVPDHEALITKPFLPERLLRRMDAVLEDVLEFPDAVAQP